MNTLLWIVFGLECFFTFIHILEMGIGVGEESQSKFVHGIGGAIINGACAVLIWYGGHAMR